MPGSTQAPPLNVTLVKASSGSYPAVMDLATIQSLIAHGESETLEFKRSTGQRSRIAEAACAMANSRGGSVLVGVRDDGLIRGQQVTATTLEALHAEIAEIEPPLYPGVTVELVDGSLSVIALEVQASPMAPHVCRGRPHKRSGPRTVVMPQAEYQRLLLERIHASARWENQTGPLLLADVDADELVRTVDAGVARGRLSDPDTREPEELLRRLGLIADAGS